MNRNNVRTAVTARTAGAISNRITAEDERVRDAVSALLEKLDKAKQPTENIKLLDEILEICRNSNSARAKQGIPVFLIQKSHLVDSISEKTALLDEIVNGYIEDPDTKVQELVRSALRERMKAVEKNDGEAYALCERLLNQHQNRLPDWAGAKLLTRKAKATKNDEEKIRLDDEVIARYLNSSDDSALDAAIAAAGDKSRLVNDKAEQIRLCDLILDTYMKWPLRFQQYRYRDAAARKAKLLGDPELAIRLHDRIIAEVASERMVVQARLTQADLLPDAQDKLVAYEEVIDKHGASTDEYVRLMVGRAMDNKAKRITDPEAKMALYRAIMEKCGDLKDWRAKALADRTAEALASLTGDTAPAHKRFEEEITRR